MTSREYYAENRDRILEYAREYYRRNRDKRVTYSRDYRERNPEKVQEQQRNYRERNPDRKSTPEYFREYYQRNRKQIIQRRREREASVTEDERQRRRERQREWKARNPGKVKERNAQYRERNRDALRERGREYRERNPGKDREYYVKNHDRIREQARQQYDPAKKAAEDRKYRHGIRLDEWEAMWAAQDGCCYLCGDELTPGKGTHIDHDHNCCKKRSCGACRRGLACHNCNVAIGLAHDDPARLRRMADALERAQAEMAARIAT